MFISVNETEQFGYTDATIVKSKVGEDYIELNVEALIVKSNNSQNSNYTDSYADIATIMIEDFKQLSFIKEGYKKYSANDELLFEIPDEEVKDKSLKDFLLTQESLYLPSFNANQIDDCFEGIMEFELPAEMGEMSDTYELKFEFSKVKISWDKYLNRVQQ